ncbi:hypothetical protein [Paenibacillus sinopodophylli]|uniref:hypothetical protein n=1 Tax=Paenibacillus sinopodophylli TaxID=1837342 RepID=UPI00110CB9BA|nr:hypothetical protein [Paenibacillus sinopodophylli]
MQPNQYGSLEEYVAAHKARTRKKQSEAKQGEKSRTAVLTEGQVVEIRNKWIPGIYGARKLAKEYGVSERNISAIISGKSWTHIPFGAYTNLDEYVAEKQAEKGKLPITRYNAKLDKDKVKAIRQRFAEGAKKYHLAKEYGVHNKTICDVLDFKIWKDV